MYATREFVWTLFFLLQAASSPALTARPGLFERNNVLPPTEDPFYVPPSGYENQKPGAILRSREVESLAFGTIVPFHPEAVYQILFRSTDSLGGLSSAVTTVIIPTNANVTRLLSYQTAEDAVWANCAPSYTLQLGATLNEGGGDGIGYELLLIIAALNQGWIVSIPDYEGPEAAYTGGIQAGQATLDSVRAVLSSESITGVSPIAEYQLWGYSGGSIATEWAAELQPSYAPELHFVGAALGGLVPSLLSVIDSLNGGAYAGFVVAGLLGLAQAYPALKDYFDTHLIPTTAASFERPLSQCENDNTNDFNGQDVFTYFDVPADTITNSTVLQSVLNASGYMGTHGTPEMPMFIYKTLGDDLSPISETDGLVTKLCSQGARIEYLRDENGNHVSESITGAGDALNFLKDRFAGVPVNGSCSTRTVANDLYDPGALEILGSAIADELLALLQFPVGPI